MAFLSRLFKFRIFKFRTTLSEELDDLHGELTNLHESISQTRSLQQKWTKWFAIYTILVYLIINTLYYTLFLSPDFVNRIYTFTISILLAVLLYGIHWTLRWYFRKMIHIKEEKLSSFKERKQELMEEVKNKETYAVAKNLLEKYGGNLTPNVRPSIVNDANKNSDLRQRISIKPNSTPVSNGNQTPVRLPLNRLAAGVTPGKLPRAILPPQRTFWGTILDTIVGDGPSKRYALICKSCSSHNGMALEEEFEYISYRCAYCNFLNGARKQKPVFNPNILSSPVFAQNGTTPQVERMEVSTVTDSSDSNEGNNESRLTRRSIRVPPKIYPDLSSSEESLSDKKK